MLFFNEVGSYEPTSTTVGPPLVAVTMPMQIPNTHNNVLLLLDLDMFQKKME